ncbi:Oidioi.mRNA.OKI2018_I69.PAR.g12781.t1.cds [Oikopleura dioica]|uniref:Oidioi.mRNA.OKI2018_I69.PAR.g12781.t1.cds n=1 Tax=Oikopleura dioica TaxID=34765 RepID=A0ABN7S527_OIKDI|nr:Oidioi.mRNA.OKI2018_I69.PAR.g12781.t1.cds [Oikopleura dioica]
MNNRRFNLQDEVNGEENRERMGAGVFMLILLAIPLQYLMSENYGVAVNQRNMQSLQLVTGATHFAKTWLDPSKWEKRFAEFQDYIDKLADELEEKQKKIKNAKKSFSKEGETPAHEVISYLGQNMGYYAHSTRVRERKQLIRYRVGQTFQHKNLGYYGVIVGWDETCRAPPTWQQQMLGSNWKEKCKQPFYAVLTSSGDSRYVMEENIKLISGNTKMTNSQQLFEFLVERNKRIEDYMDAYDVAGSRFMPRPAVDALYPDD